MDITREGTKRLERADYLGLVTYVEGIMKITVGKFEVKIALHDREDGSVLAEQSYNIDVVPELERGDKIDVLAGELETRLYSRNVASLLLLGKSPLYIPGRDSRLARLFNWLYKHFTKERI